jgi:hypothetical protein
MSLNEKFVKTLANKMSRRDFLKGLGATILGLGLTLIGTTKPAYAAPCSGGCCPGTACSDCQHAGSNCPAGYTKRSYCSCCIGGCQYTCSKCRKNSDHSVVCWCQHDDLVACPGQNCAFLHHSQEHPQPSQP